VIGEMQRHIDVKDEAGRESDLAKAGHRGFICANAAKSSSVGSAGLGAQKTGRLKLGSGRRGLSFIRALQKSQSPGPARAWRRRSTPDSNGMRRRCNGSRPKG
jgi:hypothetical protein